MILKLIIFTIGGMLLYRMLAPARPLPEDRRSAESQEYTDYEIVEDDH